MEDTSLKLFKSIYLLFPSVLLISSCQIGEDTMDTSTGNPLTNIAKYLDSNANGNINFQEAYTQTLKAESSINLAYSDGSDLALIDSDGDKKISNLEFEELERTREILFSEQDGKFDCSDEEVLKDFSQSTESYYYYDENWAGKLIEFSNRSRCISSNYNSILYKALSVIDKNKNAKIELNEFSSLYGNSISESEKIEENPWEYDYSANLKRVLFIDEQSIANTPNTMQGLFDFFVGATGLIYNSLDEKYLLNYLSTPISQFNYDGHFYSNISRLYDLGRLANRNERLESFDTITYPELAPYDLNKDSKYDLIDKLAIDFVIKISFFNSSRNCVYQEWSEPVPFFNITKTCQQEQIDNSLLENGISIQPNQVLLKRTNNIVKREQLLKSYRYLASSLYIFQVERFYNRYKILEFVEVFCETPNELQQMRNISDPSQLNDFVKRIIAINSSSITQNTSTTGKCDDIGYFNRRIKEVDAVMLNLINDKIRLYKTWEEIFGNTNELDILRDELLNQTIDSDKTQKLSRYNKMDILDIKEAIKESFNRKD